jgi:hypothetical protein
MVVTTKGMYGENIAKSSLGEPQNESKLDWIVSCTSLHNWYILSWLEIEYESTVWHRLS